MKPWVTWGRRSRQNLAIAQEDVTLTGWAMESRVYAEDPLRNFLPSIGRLTRYRPPAEHTSPTEVVRNDTGVYEGGEISMYYDPMIAKLCTCAPTRDQAIEAMRNAHDARGNNVGEDALVGVSASDRLGHRLDRRLRCRVGQHRRIGHAALADPARYQDYDPAPALAKMAHGSAHQPGLREHVDLVVLLPRRCPLTNISASGGSTVTCTSPVCRERLIAMSRSSPAPRLMVRWADW